MKIQSWAARIFFCPRIVDVFLSPTLREAEKFHTFLFYCYQDHASALIPHTQYIRLSLGLAYSTCQVIETLTSYEKSRYCMSHANCSSLQLYLHSKEQPRIFAHLLVLKSMFRTLGKEEEEERQENAPKQQQKRTRNTTKMIQK